MVFNTFEMPMASMVHVRRRKNMTEFLGEPNIPTPDAVGQTVSSLPGGGTGPDSWKIRFSGLFSPNAGAGAFSKEVSRMEQLQSKLHSYTLFGLPKVPQQLSFHHDSWEEEEEETNLSLEDSWQMLLDNPETLTRRQFHQQEAIWELLHTEATYIKKLRVITDLFLCGLLNLQESGLLTEVEPRKLFINILDVVCLHTALWNQVMVPVLKKARQARVLLDPTDLHEGFQTFGSRFKPYIRYCMEEEGSMEYMRTLLRDNELFRIYVTWAETNKQCNRLKLADMLAKPHQRLTKYPLLLKRILKKTDEPSARDIVNNMVATVEGFINSVDSKMRQRQEQQKLATISSRIDSYEAVEGSSEEVEKILKEYNRFDLMAPMRGISPEETRQLHLEGALKMKEGKDSRMDVYCFLFTDLLLITKPVKRVEKVKVIRQPLLIQNVVCKELKDPGSFILIYLNEFKSAVAAYTFQANSATQGRGWIDAICNVQNQLQRLHSEEIVRQQNNLKRSIGEEEEEEEDESSNSAASSPSLMHKNQQNSSLSDGSTETLSVMDIDEPGTLSINFNETNKENSADTSGLSDSSEVQHSLCKGLHRALSTVYSEPDLDVDKDGDKLDPQCRSLSMDSAYGTLSPESPLEELQPKPGQSEGEEMEEGIERDSGEQPEAGNEEDEEEDSSSLGSQLSVVQSAKPRRRPHIQQRYNCLQLPATLALSRSEDNLLQRLHTTPHISHSNSLNSEVQDQSKHRDSDTSLTHSQSMSELDQNYPELLSPEVNQSDDCLSLSMPSEKLCATLRRAEAQHMHHALEAHRRCSDGDIAASAGGEGTCETTASGESGGVLIKKKKSTAQQHKKLTLAQLYRIRTTLVLNSTLTASEV